MHDNRLSVERTVWWVAFGVVLVAAVAMLGAWN